MAAAAGGSNGGSGGTQQRNTAPMPFLTRMVFEDTLRLSGYVVGMILVQRLVTGQATYRDKLQILGAGMIGSVTYHALLNPTAEHTVRPRLVEWAAASAPTPTPTA
jgi:hypothetical protein